MARGRVRWIARGGVMLVPPLLALISLEFYLRWTETRIVAVDPGSTVDSRAATERGALLRYTERGRRLNPGADVVIRNHHLSGRDIPMRINSHGLRDVELAVPPPPGEWRVLVLGDSITWGDYLPAEEVYVEVAERLLDGQLGGRTPQLVNAGVGDIGLEEELDILTESGWQLQPQAVVVAFYLNDSRPPWGFPEELGERGFLRRHSRLVNHVYEWLVRREWLAGQGSVRFAWVQSHQERRWRTDRGEFLRLAEEARFDWGAAWQPSEWEALRPRFAELARQAAERQVPVAVLALPVTFQVYAEFVEDVPQRTLASLCAEHDFAFLDLLPALRAAREQAPDESLFFDQCHPTLHGNAVIGAALAAFLRQELAPEGT